MSLIRKISLDYRQARTLARIKRAEAEGQARMAQFAEALRLGVIKPPPMTLPLTARLVQPREGLKLRLGNGSLGAGTEILLRTGRRAGRQATEVKTYARKPERNKYAGMFSPGTW